MSTNDPTSESELMDLWSNALTEGVYGGMVGMSELDSPTMGRVIDLGWLANSLPASMRTHETWHPFDHAECQFDLWTGAINMIQFSSSSGHVGVAVFSMGGLAQNAFAKVKDFARRDIRVMESARRVKQAAERRDQQQGLVKGFAFDHFHADQDDMMGAVFALLVTAARTYVEMNIGDEAPTERMVASAISHTLQGLEENLELELPSKQAGKCQRCGSHFDAGAVEHTGNIFMHEIVRDPAS